MALSRFLNTKRATYSARDVRFCEVVAQRYPRNTAYPLTACRSASTCLTCSCPASRANFSVTYAHVAVHPHEQIGRLTSRLPNFSGRIVMLWVTLLIFLLLTHRNLYNRSTTDLVHRNVQFTRDDGREDHAGSPSNRSRPWCQSSTGHKPPTLSRCHAFERERSADVVSALCIELRGKARIRHRRSPLNAGPRRACSRGRGHPRRRNYPHDGKLPPPTRQYHPPRKNAGCLR